MACPLGGLSPCPHLSWCPGRAVGLVPGTWGPSGRGVSPGQVAEDEVSDNSAECVVCLSDVRDTLILPCRHLCLCNTCADTLRYQANNCPICRLRKGGGGSSQIPLFGVLRPGESFSPPKKKKKK